MPAKSIKVTPSESDALCCAPLTETPLSDGDASELAAVMAALGDPVRLRLLSLVASEGEVCSCNLEEPLGKSQPTISHHTRILSDAGLIVGEKRASGPGGGRRPNGSRQSGGSSEDAEFRTVDLV